MVTLFGTSVLRYNESRRSEVPEKIFENYTGAIQTDLYAGYNQVFFADKCKRVACLAHVRRKFLEIEKLDSKNVGKTLKLIADLYKIEREIKSKEPDLRLEVRKDRSRKILGALFEHLQQWKSFTLPKSPVMPAIEYALKQQEGIIRYTDNGEYQIDNNAIERQMRPIALGRKNWLFAGSHEGARRAAAFYSVVQTCKLCGVNPTEYIRDIIIRLPDHSKNRLDELLPAQWKAARAQRSSGGED